MVFMMLTYYRLAEEYDKHANTALADAESYLANPVNAYRLCKKFTTEIPAVKELLQSEPLIAGKRTDSAPAVLGLLIISHGL